MKKYIFAIVSMILFFVISFYSYNEENKLNNKTIETVDTAETGITHFIYFTGIGCPHCAKVDPVLLKDKVRNKDIMVIEYEIYQQRQNARLLMDYNNKYKSGLGVPLLIAGDCKNKAFIGDGSILNKLDKTIKENKANCVVLPEEKISFDQLDISKLPGLPKIWYKDRLAVKYNILSEENEIIKAFLIDGKVPEGANDSDNKEVSLSGSKAEFKNSVQTKGWFLMYN